MARKNPFGDLDKGAFTRYLKRRFGNAAFNKDGSIKLSYINRILKDKNVSTHVKRMALFAKNARKFKHK